MTSHKAALHAAAGSRFEHLDSMATLTGQINAIRRADSGLLGWARDPVSVGRVVDEIWSEPGGEVICLGGGGTAIALLAHRVRRPARPSAATVCEISDHRLDRLRDLLDRLDTDLPIRLLVGRVPGSLRSLIDSAYRMAGGCSVTAGRLVNPDSGAARGARTGRPLRRIGLRHSAAPPLTHKL